MSVSIRIGHVLTELAKLQDESVHCIWTSVPYWGLRAYGTEPQVWGGDNECAHEWSDASWKADRWGDHDDDKPGPIQKTNKGSLGFRGKTHDQQICQRCRAWRGEHGLEPTLDLWLAHEVAIWRELRRVVRKDGVAWLNCGDAYATSSNGRSADDTKNVGNDDRTFRDKPFSTVGVLKSKQRLMLPARLALALQADGWWLRDEIVWHKPNPMPSSVADRTTPAHEMLYLLTRSPRYFFDGAAIREPFADSSIARLQQSTVMDQTGGAKQDAYEGEGINDRNGSRRPNEIVQGLAQKIARRPAGWDTDAGSHSTLRHTSRKSGNKERKFGDSRDGPGCNLGSSIPWEGTSRNKRSVWTIATEPFPEAHFATAPTALVEPCILAGTSQKGCCAKCGAPWMRNSASELVPTAKAAKTFVIDERDECADTNDQGANRQKDGHKPGHALRVTTLGWSPACGCGEAPIPCTVLDPFGGAGTTGLVAARLGRDAILIELKPEYAEIAASRLRADLHNVSGVNHAKPTGLPLFAEASEASQ